MYAVRSSVGFAGLSTVFVDKSVDNLEFLSFPYGAGERSGGREGIGEGAGSSLTVVERSLTGRCTMGAAVGARGSGTRFFPSEAKGAGAAATSSPRAEPPVRVS